MDQIHLFRAFNAYLTVMFLVSLAQSLQFYLAILGLVKKAPGRWPRLVRLIGQHAGALITPGLLWPLAGSMVLMVAQWVATMFIWPAADGFILGSVPFVAGIGISIVGTLMVGWDLYRILQGTTLDARAVEPYLALAEGALHPGAVVLSRTFSLGRFNPVNIVSAELKKQMSLLDRSMRVSLWWMLAALVLRGLFALGLWITYAAYANNN